MSEKNITRITLEDAMRRKGEGKTDWRRLHREEAAGIEPERDPDEGEFDWSRAQVVLPHKKRAISVRLDADVLDFSGPGDGAIRHG